MKSRPMVIPIIQKSESKEGPLSAALRMEVLPCFSTLCVDIIPAALSGTPQVPQLPSFSGREETPAAFPKRDDRNNRVPQIRAQRTRSILGPLCSNIFSIIKKHNSSFPRLQNPGARRVTKNSQQSRERRSQSLAWWLSF